MHMSHYMVHPMMLLLSIMALPVLLTFEFGLSQEAFALLAGLLLLAMCAPSSLYVSSQMVGYENWQRRLLILPGLVVMGVGLAVSNTRAVMQALLGIPSGFVRTPKRGDKNEKLYSVSALHIGIIELAMGLYCSYSLQVYIQQAKYLVGPFLAIYASGYVFVGLLTVIHGLQLDPGRFIWLFPKTGPGGRGEADVSG